MIDIGGKMYELQMIENIVYDAMQGIVSFEDAKNRITDIESQSNISHKRVYKIIEKCYEETINDTLDKSIMTEDQEKAILGLITWIELSEKDVYKNERYMSLVKSCVIREVLEGKLPNRAKPDGILPFNFQKNEALVWLFNPCRFYQRKITTIRRGGHAGVSVKIMKGVYFRTGSFSSHPVKSESVVYIATGLCAITNKHIYFYSPQKTFRIPYRRIIAVSPLKDGITIHKDTKEKPFIFETGDGWFTYNLLVNLSQMGS